MGFRIINAPCGPVFVGLRMGTDRSVPVTRGRAVLEFRVRSARIKSILGAECHVLAKFLFLLFWTQLLVLPVFAGRTLTAEQVISEVANEAASSWPDKRIARHLDDVRLRDRMTYGMTRTLRRAADLVLRRI